MADIKQGVDRKANKRGAARLAAVQALYQQEMEKTPLAVLLHEFHQHRLGATIEDVEYADAEVDFFDDLVGTAEHTLPVVLGHLHQVLHEERRERRIAPRIMVSCPSAAFLAGNSAGRAWRTRSAHPGATSLRPDRHAGE